LEGNISIDETSSVELLREEIVSDYENDADVGEWSEEEVQPPVKVRKVQRKRETRETIKEYRTAAASSEEGESWDDKTMCWTYVYQSQSLAVPALTCARQPLPAMHFRSGDSVPLYTDPRSHAHPQHHYLILP
jgi:hypothetical protein